MTRTVLAGEHALDLSTQFTVTLADGRTLPVIFEDEGLTLGLRVGTYESDTSSTIFTPHRSHAKISHAGVLTHQFLLNASGTGTLLNGSYTFSAPLATHQISHVPPEGAEITVSVDAMRLSPDRLLVSSNLWQAIWLSRTGDADGDGLSNIEELRDYQSDPFVQDFDLMPGRIALVSDVNDQRTSLRIMFNRDARIIAPETDAVLVEVLPEHNQPGQVLTGISVIDSDAPNTIIWTPDMVIPPGRVLRVYIGAGNVGALDSAQLIAEREALVDGPEFFIKLETLHGEFAQDGEQLPIILEGDSVSWSVELLREDGSTSLSTIDNYASITFERADDSRPVWTIVSDQQSFTTENANAGAKRFSTTLETLGISNLLPGSRIQDGDVITGDWQWAYGQPSLRPGNLIRAIWLSETGDVDGDGFSNRDELMLFDTDPFVSDSGPLVGKPVLRPAINAQDATLLDVLLSEPAELTGTGQPVVVTGTSPDGQTTLSISGTTTLSADGLTLTFESGSRVGLGWSLEVEVVQGTLRTLQSVQAFPRRVHTMQGAEVAIVVNGSPSTSVDPSGWNTFYMIEGRSVMGWLQYTGRDGDTTRFNAWTSTYGRIKYIREIDDQLLLSRTLSPSSFYSTLPDNQGYKGSLGNITLGTGLTSPLQDGERIRVQYSSETTSNLVRVQATEGSLVWLSQSGDFDGDGLNNLTEFTTGSNPLVAE